MTARTVPSSSAPIAEKKVSLIVIQNAPSTSYLSKISSMPLPSAGWRWWARASALQHRVGPAPCQRRWTHLPLRPRSGAGRRGCRVARAGLVAGRPEVGLDRLVEGAVALHLLDRVCDLVAEGRVTLLE